MMSPHESLVARIRGEYTEMPGLRLTLAQACRLWQMDTANCESVLQTLVNDSFLVRTKDGVFIALPMYTRPTAAKATLRPASENQSHRRRPA
jgi:hypothetical protein